MGLDKQNVNRGKCTEVDCKCSGYERIGDGNRCSTCRHVAVKHVVIGATGSHKSVTNLPAHHSEDHDVKKCYRCSSQYSSSKHGACITCYPRDQCSNPKCTELAYYDKDLGSFNYCSRECRDESELKRANKELQRGLKEFEDVPSKDASNRSPGRSSDKRVSNVGATSSDTQVTTTITATRPFIARFTSSTWSSTWSNQSSPHMTSNMSVGSASQPTTSTGTVVSQSDTSSTIPTNPPVVTSHRQSSQTVTSQPQSLSQNFSGYITGFSVPAGIFYSSNITFHDGMKAVTIHGNTGILVSAITLDEEKCDLRPLDLLTHIKGKAIKDMLGFEGRVWLTRIPRGRELWLTVQRVCHIPPVEELKMSFFDGENVPRTSLGIYTSKLAAVSCTSKDLEECATFLGVSMEGGAGYSSKKIGHVIHGSIGWDIGLSKLCTIVSIAMVTTEKALIGPEPNWSFEYIKSTARKNSGICALLLLLQK